MAPDARLKTLLGASIVAVAVGLPGVAGAQSGDPDVPVIDGGWQEVQDGATPSPSSRRGNPLPGPTLEERSEGWQAVPEGAGSAPADPQAPTAVAEVLEFGREGSRAALGAAPRPGQPPEPELSSPVIDSGALPAPPGGTRYDMPRPGSRPVGTPTLDENDLDLFAGEVRVLGQVDVTRVAIGRGSILDAQILANGELLLLAQAAGSTSLRLWNVDGSQSSFNIRISAEDPETRIRMERMVRMRVRLVEFRKSALGSLGIDWNADGIAGPTLAIAGDAVGNNFYRPQTEGFDGLPNRVEPFSTYFGIASSITSRINFLSSRGDAVTIAEPVLSAINGGAATFLAGGEVPYPSVDGEGNPIVDFKEYGIKLDIAPLIDRAGNVRARVETEISQLDPSVTVLDAPGLLTRRATTELNVRTGETIVISGLLSAENSEDIDRLPGLGRLPVIGALFRSKNIRNSVSELVIFVTPEVIDPADGRARMTERERLAREDSTERLNSARDRLFLMD